MVEKGISDLKKLSVIKKIKYATVHQMYKRLKDDLTNKLRGGVNELKASHGKGFRTYCNPEGVKHSLARGGNPWKSVH